MIFFIALTKFFWCKRENNVKINILGGQEIIFMHFVFFLLDCRKTIFKIKFLHTSKNLNVKID
jgi:hypothetical protein